MVPSAKDNPACAVDQWRESATGRMVDHKQVACGGLQAPQARHGRCFLVFVQLRVQMSLPSSGTIAGENDAVIRAVNGSDIIEIGWLVRNLGNHRGVVRISEMGDFIELPGSD